ncbi:class I SAM-dependent methyltransferase [Petroclostridium sp. X23]|uniref:class I SAM-dependent methyltransferase n=1 Tax=Petroclostridium sp. X23 TaxID=3045146 RepID=UPI0024ADCD71|nr:class I SAM-dependent methyltransferase [Petroclostridium sp. X23]WHH59467.1 class I SAM-dependent methyltransferase [Petroclostridium sp. X23]
MTMELSPRIYDWFVRPKWFTEVYINNKVLKEFDFSNKKILDFGCGVGSSCTMFTPNNYLGMDVDADRVKYAAHVHPGYNFSTIENMHIPVLQHSIDYILIISVLHHIPSEQLTDYLKEYRRILKNNGKILVIEPCVYDHCPVSNHFMALFDKGKYIRNEDEYVSIFTEQRYKVEVLKRFSQLYFYNKLFFTATLDER